MAKAKSKVIYNISVTALFTALIAVCSWISVQIGPVPFTMQTFAVMCAAGILGLKRGVAATATYILLGMVGVPVFHGFTGGIGIITGATGGYIVGFLATVAIVGSVSEAFGRRLLPLILSMIVGLALCYSIGTAWYIIVYTSKGSSVGITSAIAKCVLPFLIPDAVKLSAAAVAVNRACSRVRV